MKNQTAVEWLQWELQGIHPSQIEWLQTFDQAKAMEKEQIIDASNGYSTKELLGVTKGEQYYNETYEK